MQSATGFAPATVANVTVGFDVLGFAVADVGDHVTVERDPGDSGVSVVSIEGVVTNLPTVARRNTASAALLALVEHCRPAYGFRVFIRKGIPLGSGMGGSAASAVAAVVAANALLDAPLPRDQLLPFCLAGEKVASGAAHADNAAASLFGGLVAVVGEDPPRVARIPVPSGLHYALVHPHLEIETRTARQALAATIPLSVAVEQSMSLSGFLAGCFGGDLELIRASMTDRFAEPVRSASIPGFEAAKRAALAAGALGFGISGSGPSVFAWCSSEAVAQRVSEVSVGCFVERALACDTWVGPLGASGAAVSGTA